MQPGQHFVLISQEPMPHGRYQGWELRDTLLMLLPGPSTLLATLYRVPLSEATVAAQVLANGQGGLWIDGCRVETTNSLGGGRLKGPTDMTNTCGGPEWDRPWMHDESRLEQYKKDTAAKVSKAEALGRWPANLLLVHHPECKDACHPECPVPWIDRQSGVTVSTGGRNRNITPSLVYGSGLGLGSSSAHVTAEEARGDPGFGDVGGASRYYPQFPNLRAAVDWLERLTGGGND